jgi:hypothetical protein
MNWSRGIWGLIAGALLALLAFGVLILERDRAQVDTRVVETPDGAFHVVQRDPAPDAPLVVIAHGFAGSVQMMSTIARDLARAGYVVAPFDFIGHGRHSGRMSARVTEIEGTTAQLVAQTEAVVAAARAELGAGRPLVLLGHSMATDILIRAARNSADAEAIIAISMYSEAVTPDFPQRLLVISGAWEDRLRVAGREVVRMIDAEADEGETVRAGEVVRRAVAIPNTEHVAVLYAEATLIEIRNWLAMIAEPRDGVPVEGHGPVILAALALVVGVFAALLPAVAEPLRWSARLPTRGFLLAAVLPFAAAFALNFLATSALGLAGFGALALWFGGAGAFGLILLWRAGRRLGAISCSGLGLFAVGGLAFAVALDRYGAAFVPTGPRLGLLALLLPATIVYMLYDRLLVAGAALWQRVLARSVALIALLAVMLARPEVLGLLFTVLPVLFLFFCVFGTMAHLVSRHFGTGAAGIGAGGWLAWAIASSTPLFVG